MKNLLLSFVLLITSATVFAQLYVAPVAPNKDSYIYVAGEILYVEGAIELHNNRPGQEGWFRPSASIYLREKRPGPGVEPGVGQLIQGGTTSANTGDGFLSVKQHTKPTNAYAYYYWCSPVGNPLTTEPLTYGNNVNFGLSSLYEESEWGYPESRIDGRRVETTSSKEGFTDPNLTISRRWMYIHPTPGTEAEDTYIRINATDGVPAGFGFTMKGVNLGSSGADPPTGPDYGHDQVYEFRGRPNNGDFKITVKGPIRVNPTDPARVDANMTLTGNPYPSALDLNKVFYAPGNEALGEIYYYDEDRSVMSHYYSLKPFGYGVWVPGEKDDYNYPGGVPDLNKTGTYTAAAFNIWNAAGQQVSGSGTGTSNPWKRFAPIGQGFMFVGKSDGDVWIRNSHRIFIKEGAANESVFQRPDGENGDMEVGSQSGNGIDASRGPALDTAEGTPQVDTRTPLLRLYVVFDDALTRDMVLVFSPEATDGYDRGYDGLSPGGMKSDAYFPIGPDSNRLPYVIQGTNYEPRKMVPITFKLHKTSQIEIRAVEEIRKPYQKVYLFDRQENIYRELIKPHSAASTFSLPAGTYDDRFFLVFRDGPRLGNQEDLADAQDRAAGAVNMFQNNPARQLEISNPDGYTLKAAYVYDMNGKLVITENKLGDSSSYSFYTGNLSDGMYIVKLITSDDITINYKAMVVNK